MERQASTIHINKFVDLPDGSTVQIVASGPLLTFLVIQKQQNGSRILYESERSQIFRYKVTAVFVRGLFS